MTKSSIFGAFFALLMTLVSTNSQYKTFYESLDIYPMPNNFSLINFDFEFEIAKNKGSSQMKNIDKFPKQILELINSIDPSI